MTILVLPNPPKPAYRKLRVWSVAAPAMYENGDPARYDLSDKRDPSPDEIASDEFGIGKVVNGRCQYVETVGPWMRD